MKPLQSIPGSREGITPQRRDNTEFRKQCGHRAAWASILTNTILFVIKLFIGIYLGSIAVIADSIHTLSDMATSIVVLIGFNVAVKPGDREHPFGHGRAESVATLIVCVLLIVTGVELLRSSGARIVHPGISTAKITMGWVIVIGLTALVKVGLGLYTDRLSRKIDSALIHVDSWHHYSDALSTVVVIAGLAAGYYGYQALDGVAGVLVSAVVIYTGIKLGRQAVSPLLGEPPDSKTLKRIEELAKTIPGVQGVHELIVHRYGQVHIITVHIEVPEDRPVIELHEISEQVENAVEREFKGTTVVHLDPICRNHPRYDELRTLIENEIRSDRRIHSYHDLRIVGHGRWVKAVFDILSDDGITDDDASSAVLELHHRLKCRLSEVRWIIKSDPRYTYSN